MVVSDGTIAPESSALIRSILPGAIEVQSVEGYAEAALPETVRDFMAKSPWGGKLATIMTLSDRAPALYIDADVLCFPRASELRDMFADGPPRFMLDAGPYLDQRMLPHEAVASVAMPANAGMLFVPRPLDWTLSVARLREITGEAQRPLRADRRTPCTSRRRGRAFSAEPLHRQPISDRARTRRP